MYKAGKLDIEIANALTVSRQTITRWRLDLGLKTNDPRRYQKEVNTKYDWDLAMQLYEKNYSDGAIAAALGCKSQTVQKWRKRNNLPSKHKIQKEEKSESGRRASACFVSPSFSLAVINLADNTYSLTVYNSSARFFIR